MADLITDSVISSTLYLTDRIVTGQTAAALATSNTDKHVTEESDKTRDLIKDGFKVFCRKQNRRFSTLFTRS
jgi:hypothetical protein